MSAGSFAVEAVSPVHRRLVARAAFARGDALMPFRFDAHLPAPDRHTLQLSETAHGLLDPPELRFVDHACDPNAFFDLEAGRLVALRDIAAGDAVTAFYPATEWSMAEPFDCQCGSPRCLGVVRGARDLPPARLDGHRLAPHVARALATRPTPRDRG